MSCLFVCLLLDAASFTAELAVLCSLLYKTTFSLSLSLSRKTQSRTHKLCLSPLLALRHGFDGSVVTVLGSEHSDREEEREMVMGERMGGLKKKTDESKGGKQQ